MSKFKPGQKLVCVIPRDEYWTDGKGFVDGPKFNDIVTSAGKAKEDQAILLLEWPDPEGWYHVHFEPIVSDAVLREELESVPEPFTI